MTMFTIEHTGEAYVETVGQLVGEYWIGCNVQRWAIDLLYDPSLGFAYSEFFRETGWPLGERKKSVPYLTTSSTMDGKAVWYPSLYELGKSLVDHPSAIRNRCQVIPDFAPAKWDEEWQDFWRARTLRHS